MLWSTLLSPLTSTISTGALGLLLPRWILEPSIGFMATATAPLERLYPLVTTEQATSLGCNTSQSTIQWFGWLLVLAVLFVAQRPSEHERQQAIRIRVKPNRE
jgi:hypothetical protein